MSEILALKDIKNSQQGFEKNVAETSQTVWFRRQEALRRESKDYFSVLVVRLPKRYLMVYYQRAQLDE